MTCHDVLSYHVGIVTAPASACQPPSGPPGRPEALPDMEGCLRLGEIAWSPKATSTKEGSSEELFGGNHHKSTRIMSQGSYNCTPQTLINTLAHIGTYDLWSIPELMASATALANLTSLLAGNPFSRDSYTYSPSVYPADGPSVTCRKLQALQELGQGFFGLQP